MWVDTATHTVFVAVSHTTCVVPGPGDEDGDSAQILLRTEVVDFDVVPLTSKTGDSIRIWFAGVLIKRAEIPYAAVSGVTPDGAADGQCGLSLIAEISEKVYTCILHQLQRSVLYSSIGLAGAKTKNEDSKVLLKKHNRIVTLTHQSLSFGKSIRKTQSSANIPEASILSLEKTATTRWGNQFVQLQKNCVLRLAIDSCLQAYKQENRQNKEAIVETNESEEGSKVGVAVAASEIGLDLSDWDRSQELEGFLSYPYAIKDTLEHSGVCTGSQAMILLHDLKENFCNEAATLEVKQFPETLQPAHRSRTSEIRAAQDLSTLITSAREIMKDELESRIFTLRPPNSRLIQCYMTKQAESKTILSPAQHELAKTLYLSALREAEVIREKNAPTAAGISRATYTQAKKQKLGGGLFRGLTAVGLSQARTAGSVLDDPVQNEIRRWESLLSERPQPFFREDGLLNEFFMCWQLRKEFPLHLIVFMQHGSHLPHEANCEQVFSIAGYLSDPNLDPSYLGTLTSIGINKAAYKPPLKDIKARYFSKYRGRDRAEESAE
ncbi:hypothetical protein CYMTET_6636 [Cymbomonas tetramitiformis]|uniref:Uncharacterized protein n=1 Tax=Cymbomonas tetramitiformis TaxID=36881 RepID=A0AAE0GYK2_9CHLO|nr:hypothetical protein CYMTET_6636 [Cymbomonas tetramitiformis]